MDPLYHVLNTPLNVFDVLVFFLCAVLLQSFLVNYFYVLKVYSFQYTVSVTSTCVRHVLVSFGYKTMAN